MKKKIVASESNYGKRRSRREMLTAYLMLFPAMIGFLLFYGIPILSLFVLVSMKYDIISPPIFSGLRNIKHFFQDTTLPKVYFNTIKFAAFLIPLHITWGMFLAYCVSRVNKKLQYLCRTIIYFPTIVTTASVAIAWAYMYSKDLGVFNYFLTKIGIVIPWLTSSKWSIPAIVIFSLWKFIGVAFLYLFIGIQNVPISLQEAAEIDGANARQTFFKVTLPMISPILLFVVITTVISSIQMFDEPYLITSGGPGDSSRTISLYIYEQAFRSYDMGYAATLATSLFFFILIVTLVQFKFSKRWVNYDN